MKALKTFSYLDLSLAAQVAAANARHYTVYLKAAGYLAVCRSGRNGSAQPPHGGAAFDYIAWTLEVPGVTRAWVWPEQYGDGTVAVTFVMDDKVGSIIPSAGEVAAVQAHIDALRPVTADPTVFAPTAAPVNFEVHLNPNSSAVQNAVKAEVEDLFRREAAPGGTLYISRIREAVSAAAGEYDHVLVTPAANVVAGFGAIPVVGSWTFAGL